MTIVQALIFDLDGVLWTSNSYHDLAFKSVCMEFGLDPVDYTEIAGKTTPEAWKLIADRSAMNLSSDLLQTLSERKRELFLQACSKAQIRDDDLEKLNLLFPDTIWALVTGASAGTMKAFLERSAFKERFTITVNAESGLASKPDPESYNFVISELGLSSEDCIIFEDSEHGLAAALNSGAKVVHVTNSELPCKAHSGSTNQNLLTCVTSPAAFIDGRTK